MQGNGGTAVMTQPLGASPIIGSVIGGKYRVERLIGMGGMGAVFAARHLDLDEVRAIKVMHAEMLGDPDVTERFLREARACVRLRSVHVARVLDLGRLETGAPYIVMEYLLGQDLRCLIRERGTLRLDEAISYLLQIGETLAEAHGLGIVHRDIKPANVFLTTCPNGAPLVKLLDFGISKLIHPMLHDRSDLTHVSAVLGSPAYMSPEQVTRPRDVDARADIWSLGVILYEMITGRRPFAGGGRMGVIGMILEGEPIPPSVLRPDLPRSLEALILQCLEKSPERRPASVAELMASLRALGMVDPVSMASGVRTARLSVPDEQATTSARLRLGAPSAYAPPAPPSMDPAGSAGGGTEAESGDCSDADDQTTKVSARTAARRGLAGLVSRARMGGLTALVALLVGTLLWMERRALLPAAQHHLSGPEPSGRAMPESTGSTPTSVPAPTVSSAAPPESPASNAGATATAATTTRLPEPRASQPGISGHSVARPREGGDGDLYEIPAVPTMTAKPRPKDPPPRSDGPAAPPGPASASPPSRPVDDPFGRSQK